MRKVLLVLALLVLAPMAAQAQSIAVDLNKAVLSWTFVPDAASGVVDGYEVSCGQSSRNYSQHVTVPATTTQIPVKDIITGNGNWFCLITAFNSFGQLMSNEVFFVVGAAPSGLLTLQVQAQ